MKDKPKKRHLRILRPDLSIEEQELLLSEQRKFNQTQELEAASVKDSVKASYIKLAKEILDH